MEREALKLALEALESMQMYAAAERKGLRICDEAITTIKEALAQPPQEPVAWVSGTYGCRFVYDPINRATILPIGMALYAGPPQREWVGLTEKDFSAINQSCLTKLQAATSAESILKEKNS